MTHNTHAINMTNISDPMSTKNGVCANQMYKQTLNYVSVGQTVLAGWVKKSYLKPFFAVR